MYYLVGYLFSMLSSPCLMLLLLSHCLPHHPVCVGSTWASCERLTLPQGSCFPALLLAGLSHPCFPTDSLPGSLCSASQTQDAASLEYPKVASQLFRGKRESCNVSSHMCRYSPTSWTWAHDLVSCWREQQRGVVAKWSLRKGMLKPCCTLIGVITE